MTHPSLPGREAAARQAAKAAHVDALAFAPPWRCGCVILWAGTLFEGRVVEDCWLTLAFPLPW